MNLVDDHRSNTLHKVLELGIGAPYEDIQGFGSGEDQVRATAPRPLDVARTNTELKSQPLH